jgi:purine nucleoside permease
MLPIFAALVAPRVLVVATFPGEAARWLARDRLVRRIAAPGLDAPAACNARGTECVIVTGMGKVNAATSMLAAGLGGALDLRRSYVLLAGIAGTTPGVASVGSVAWAGWVVDGGIAHEIDPREPFTTERFSRSRLGCAARPWCAAGWPTGTERFRLNPPLRDWAYAVTRTLPLRDAASVRTYRAHYAGTVAGDSSPRVLACDVLGDDTYWHGAIMSAWATWWVSRWTDGRGRYCMSAMEDSGFMGGVGRLAALGRVDPARVLILRGASDYDRPYRGQSPAQSLATLENTGGVPLAFDNVYLAGEAVVRRLLARP